MAGLGAVQGSKRAAGAQWQDIFYASFDDLRLHARYYPAAGSEATPLLCLPGLTRNSAEFHELAVALSTDAEAPRPVYAVDYRGRGLSQFDNNWRNYTPAVELRDVLDLFAVAGIGKADILGTSRGGLIALAMAAARPTAMGAVVLNDVGPVLEPQGLARIMTSFGNWPLPPSWKAAETLLRETEGPAFPAVAESEWAAIARARFNEKDGRPAPGFDPDLMKSFGEIDISRPLPALWQQFEALTPFPVLVLRGAKSDLLSEATVQEMASRHPNLRSLTVPGQGHAPLLRDSATIDAVARFLASCEG